MTRAQEIELLRNMHALAVQRHKRKEASIIFARLSGLVLRQLKAEMRAERREHAVANAS